jgi:hypothetical protein
MADVETLGVELGEPGFFYPFGIWDLGMGQRPDHQAPSPALTQFHHRRFVV